MKRVVYLLLALVVSCSNGDYIQRQAIRYTRAQYGDFNKLIHCSVDTVTIGDNLDYRIEQAQQNLRVQESLHDADGIRKAEIQLTRLDSLKKASDPMILAKPTAYNCGVQYNSVGNFVWVQLDEFGGLLSISKDRRTWLLNPGEDAPGYIELLLKQ